MRKMLIMLFSLSLLITVGAGCTELNLDELVLVPALNAMVDAVTDGIQDSIDHQITNTLGEGPIPEAAADGLSSAANSLVEYAIDETIGDRIPD